MRYPPTKQQIHTDTYFNQEIQDPYHWLEDDMAQETTSWTKQQNQTTETYLEQIPFRDAIKNRLKTLWNYTRRQVPFVQGTYVYYFENDGLQQQPILYRHPIGQDQEIEIFLDPNTLSVDGSAAIGAISFSKDTSKMAYILSNAGSDWGSIHCIDTQTKTLIEPPIEDVKFSQITWKDNLGFYYSTYKKPEKNALSAKTKQHLLFFHALGTTQDKDPIIFGQKKEQQYRYIQAKISSDSRFLAISAANTTSGNALYIYDLEKNNTLHTLCTQDTDDIDFLDSDQENLYFKTNRQAPYQKIIQIKISDAMLLAHSTTFLMPTNGIIKEVILDKKEVLVQYEKKAMSKIIRYNYKAEIIGEIPLETPGSITDFSGDTNAGIYYFNFANYALADTIYCYNSKDACLSLYWSPSIASKGQYITKEVIYPSKDGTDIPMLITYKKGMLKNGQNPTILYGYGGFNISVVPKFSVATLFWLEQGGIYAVANIRGGGEFGKSWHIAGTKLQKQNVFDDFIAAAAFLIQQNYTSKRFLAIQGGSNGGLLVGATMTQRPDLMQVALPNVGVLDMLRYHEFTSGAGWAYDYGTSKDNLAMFLYLKSYSPVHNVSDKVQYPATLITTADHDDRVVPAHSFKFAAHLQNPKNQNTNPVLLRVTTGAGHGAGMSTQKAIALYTDIFSFTLHAMGVTPVL